MHAEGSAPVSKSILDRAIADTYAAFKSRKTYLDHRQHFVERLSTCILKTLLDALEVEYLAARVDELTLSPIARFNFKENTYILRESEPNWLITCATGDEATNQWEFTPETLQTGLLVILGAAHENEPLPPDEEFYALVESIAGSASRHPEDRMEKTEILDPNTLSGPLAG